MSAQKETLVEKSRRYTRIEMRVLTPAALVLALLGYPIASLICAGLAVAAFMLHINRLEIDAQIKEAEERRNDN